MRRFGVSYALALILALAAAPATAQNVGDQAGAFGGQDWFNTAPLGLQQLKGKLILLELFATW